MKYWMIIPAIAVLTACSAQESDAPVIDAPTDEAAQPAGPYSADNLAFSDACFDETDRSAHLEDGQSLLERGPDAIVVVAYNQNGLRGNHSFPIMQMPAELRDRVDAAAATFFREAGQAYDVTTDHVIYHREQDGTFCAVVNVDTIAGPLATEARAIQADWDAVVTAETPDQTAEDTVEPTEEDGGE